MKKQIKLGKYSDYMVTFIILIILSFLLPRLVPGDPVSVIYGGSEGYGIITEEMHEAIEMRLGLSQSLPIQFMIHVKNLVKFDLGNSYVYTRPVNELILQALPWTLLLVIISMTITMVLGIFLGVESAFYHTEKYDKIILTFLMGISGFPQFFIGILLLILFGVHLNWLPVAGARTAFSEYHGLALVLDYAKHLILPVTTIVLTEVSGVFLLARNTSLVVKEKPYYQGAMTRGVGNRTMKYKYLGLNILPIMINFMGMRLGKILVGELMVEVVFSYPGLGSLIYKSVVNRDYPVLQGLFIFIAVMVLCSSFLTELYNQRIISVHGGRQ